MLVASHRSASSTELSQWRWLSAGTPLASWRPPADTPAPRRYRAAPAGVEFLGGWAGPQCRARPVGLAKSRCREDGGSVGGAARADFGGRDGFAGEVGECVDRAVGADDEVGGFGKQAGDRAQPA